MVLCLVVLLSCGVKLFAIDLSSSRLGLLQDCGSGETVVVGVVWFCCDLACFAVHCRFGLAVSVSNCSALLGFAFLKSCQL